MEYNKKNLCKVINLPRLIILGLSIFTLSGFVFEPYYNDLILNDKMRTDTKFRFSGLDLQDNKINIQELGANGNDALDDWEPIQHAIDRACNSGGGIVYCPKGKYILMNKSLVIWGSNVIFEGEGISETILEKRGNAGWWGDAIAIAGKISGGKYYGGFGNLDYSSFLIYKGSNVQSDNIKLRNLTIKTNSSKISHLANNLGIVNSSDVYVSNCRIENAPQTNVAVVNDTKSAKNVNIEFTRCIFSNPGDHNFRVISYEFGPFKGNSVTIDNCQFLQVKSASKLTEIKNRKVHLWYRGGAGGSDISLNILNSTFDGSGDIIGTVNINRFSLTNSVVDCRVLLAGNSRYRKGAVKIKNNRFNFKNQSSAIVSITGISEVHENENKFFNTIPLNSRIRID